MSLRPSNYEAAKASHKPMRRSPMPRSTKRLGPGKKSKDWDKKRALLKKAFAERGITRCEFRFIPHECWGENLGFAHCKKRRLLQDGEIWHVALACQSVHTVLDEKMSHEEMHDAVHQAIANHGGVILPSIQAAQKRKAQT